jgi:hypothetical protein
MHCEIIHPVIGLILLPVVVWSDGLWWNADFRRYKRIFTDFSGEEYLLNISGRKKPSF